MVPYGGFAAELMKSYRIARCTNEERQRFCYNSRESENALF